MKKLVSVFLGLLLCVPVMAAQITVQPTVGVKFADEFKTRVDAGANVVVSQLNYVPDEVEVSTGLSYSELTSSDSSIQDVSLYTIPITVGYKYTFDEKLSVKPFIGADILLADSDAVDNTVGLITGAEFAYKVNENWSANLSAGFEFASTDVNGVEQSLNGAVLSGGATYKF